MATTFHTTDALGIVLELMDHIGQQVTVTRWVRDELHTDEDSCWFEPVHEAVAGELWDVRATQRGGEYIRVTVITRRGERYCDTAEVLLRGAGGRPGTPFHFEVH